MWGQPPPAVQLCAGALDHVAAGVLARLNGTAEGGYPHANVQNLMSRSSLAFIKFLEHVERLLALSSVRNQTLAIEVVLNSRQRTPRRTKIHQQPWRHSRHLWNTLPHRQLVVEYIPLIFLSKTRVGVAMQIVLGVGAKFADYDRLLIGKLPLRMVGVFDFGFV